MEGEGTGLLTTRKKRKKTYIVEDGHEGTSEEGMVAARWYMEVIAGRVQQRENLAKRGIRGHQRHIKSAWGGVLERYQAIQGGDTRWWPN